MAQIRTNSETRATLVEHLGKLIGDRAGVRLVYGEPVERDGATIVPVARVRYGFGGGAGKKPGEEGAEEEGGGGGGGVVASPAGFVILRGGQVEYRPIRDPARLTGLAIAIGIGLVMALRAIVRLATERERHAIEREVRRLAAAR